MGLNSKCKYVFKIELEKSATTLNNFLYSGSEKEMMALRKKLDKLLWMTLLDQLKAPGVPILFLTNKINS